MANITGRHNKNWTTGQIKKLRELKDEVPTKVAFVLGKTVGSVHQEKFRRGWTKSKPRLKDDEINSILILNGIGFNAEQISIMIGRPYHSIYGLCKRGGI